MKFIIMLQEPSSRQQIRNLLIVLGSGILSAVLLAAFLVYNYGPSGKYALKSALLEPQLVLSLNYNDKNPKTGGLSRFVFDSIEFTYTDPETKRMRTTPVSLETYGKFYRMIASDTSLQPVSENVLSLFPASAFATLAINVRTESPAEWQNYKKPFQKIEFSNDNNHYRIELHEITSGSPWIYFAHDQIYSSTLQLLIP